MNVLLALGAAYNLAFAAFHLFGLRRFGLMTDLRFVTPQTAKLVRLLNFGLSFFLVLTGWIYLAHGRELMTTALGRVLLTGLALFWTWRATMQVREFGYKSRFEQSWVAIFAVGAVLFVVPAAAAWLSAYRS